MTEINLELPRSALATHVLLAGLAAIGLMTLFPPGGRAQATVVLPVLTVFLALGTIVVWRRSIGRAGHVGDSTIHHQDTGVATALAGQQALAREFAAAQRGRTLTVALFRIEELGRHRALYGPVVAAQLVRKAGRMLGRNRRAMHVVAEVEDQPDTFLAILAGVDREGAAIYATRVRRQLMSMTGVPEAPDIGVGVAAFDMSMDSPKDLLRRASIGLRKGAANGRVVVVGDVAAETAGAARYF
ncbi:MAG: diguanylate cyclase [Longimicrobiales bacterium]|nr:diguanylate cyclase [Longimicrobiales bacterium]